MNSTCFLCLSLCLLVRYRGGPRTMSTMGTRGRGSGLTWNRASATCHSMPDRPSQGRSSSLLDSSLPQAYTAFQRRSSPVHSLLHSLLLLLPVCPHPRLSSVTMQRQVSALSSPPSLFSLSCLMKSERSTDINIHCRQSFEISLHGAAG